MNKQIELRRKDIADRFAHAWNKSSQRIPISVKEYRALLDLWEACVNLDPIMVTAALEKLEKGW